MASDLISRKALLERLEKIYGTNSIVDKIMLRFLKKLICKQPTVDRWIPCSERQPKEPEYGCGSEDGYIVQSSYIHEPFSAYWDGKVWSDVDGSILDSIIAWQPLPEPYKEGKNNG